MTTSMLEWTIHVPPFWHRFEASTKTSISRWITQKRVGVHGHTSKLYDKLPADMVLRPHWAWSASPPGPDTGHKSPDNPALPQSRFVFVNSITGLTWLTRSGGSCMEPPWDDQVQSMVLSTIRCTARTNRAEQNEAPRNELTHDTRHRRVSNHPKSISWDHQLSQPCTFPGE